MKFRSSFSFLGMKQRIGLESLLGSSLVHPRLGAPRSRSPQMGRFRDRCALWPKEGRVAYTGCTEVLNASLLVSWRSQITHGQPLNFAEALDGTRHFSATLDHDRLYAMLGLVSPGVLPDEGLIDYTIPVGHVYTKVAKYLIKNTRSLDIMSCVRDASVRVKYDVPSWAPDWTALPPMVSIGYPRNPEGYNAAAGIPYLPPDSSLIIYAFSMRRQSSSTRLTRSRLYYIGH